MLSKISPELFRNYASQLKQQDTVDAEKLYKEMFEQQPCFKILATHIIHEENMDNEWKDGYLKGLLQAWHLLNQQAIIDELES